MRPVLQQAEALIDMDIQGKVAVVTGAASGIGPGLPQTWRNVASE